MIKSINMMKSRRYNIMGYAITHVLQFISCPTDIVRWVALVFALMMAVVGSVHAQEEETLILWDGDATTGTLTIDVPTAIVADSYDGGLICIDVNEDHTIYIADVEYKNLWDGSYNADYSGSPYYNSEKKRYEFDITKDIINKIIGKKINVQGKNGTTFTKVYLVKPEKDEFPSELKPTGKTDSYTTTEIDPKTTTSISLDINKVLDALGTAPKYLRFYVTKGGKPVDLSTDNTLLTVSGVDVQHPAKGTNGIYVYNGGNGLDLSNLSVTLNVAAAGTFSQYQVVCVLSTDDAKGANGNEVTQEPDWDLQYTFKFENEVKKKTELIADDYLKETSLEISNYRENSLYQDILNELGATESNMKSSGYARWYIRNKHTLEKQKFSIGTSGNSWTIEGKWPFELSNDEFYCCASKSEYWYDSDKIKGFRFHVPNDRKLYQCSDYEIVFECTDEYTSGDPIVKLQYVFQIPEVKFEGEKNTGAMETSKTQTVTRTAESVTVDVSEEAPGAKYARFYLLSSMGEQINPEGLLEIANGIPAWDKPENGYFIYNNGSELSEINVTFKAPRKYKNYKVVGLFSTFLDNIKYIDPEMMEEPDWDLKCVYSFVSEVTTKEYSKVMEWDTAAMSSDADSNIKDEALDSEWNTSWEELAQGQRVKWFVEDADGNKQPLAIGNARQAGTWIIALPEPFAVDENNVALLSGQTEFSSSLWRTWGKPMVYAPLDNVYTKIASCRIVCEIAADNDAASTPNARYIFTLHKKGFEGAMKSEAASETIRVKHPSGETSKTINVEVPAGTKYARFYLTNSNGKPVAPAGLSVDGGTAVPNTIEGYVETLGVYINNESGITAPVSVTLTLTDYADFEKYNIVCLTSANAAFLKDGVIKNEPDFDHKQTYWFKTSLLGEMKETGKTGGKLVDNIEAATTEYSLDLGSALAAFKAEYSDVNPKYVRVYLTKDGIMLNPTENVNKMEISGGNTFEEHPEYGYYISSPEGIESLNNAALTLPAGMFEFYRVVVAFSEDITADVAVDEPDYDYVYTYRFKDFSSFPGKLKDDAKRQYMDIVMVDNGAAKADIKLSEVGDAIAAEAGYTDFAAYAKDGFHIRWFVVKKNEDGEYVKISNSENYLTAATDGQGHAKEVNQGLYWNSALNSVTDNSVLDVTLDKPGTNWEDYQVMAWISHDLTGQIVTDGKLTHEPDNIERVYVFSVYERGNFKFIHSKGASGRDYITSKDDSRIKGTVQQYVWNSDSYDNAPKSDAYINPMEGVIENADGDIRQGVHTVEYEMYVDPSSETPYILYLPIQNYDQSSANNLEPAAYFRWYDWETDTNNSRLNRVGDKLKELTETTVNGDVSRGWFALSQKEYANLSNHNNVGVTFDGKGLEEDEVVRIACDVSKYYDGILPDGDGYMLVHEPTISTRYIFTIRHAKVMADKIKAGKEKLEAGGKDMFELAEDNGRYCVSVKDENTEFSVRANLGRISYYYMYNKAGDVFENCTSMTWVPYYEDEQGLWKYCGAYENMSGGTISGASSKPRIHSFKVSALNGWYELMGTPSAKKEITDFIGTRVHMVGYMVGSEPTYDKQPAVHYEMIFIKAPAYDGATVPVERKGEYLKQNMTLQAELTFDDYFKDEEDGLSTVLDHQRDNHLYAPMAWDEVEYGFCYPQLDKCRVHVNGVNDFSGISPLHGDYILLKSMNMKGVSESGQTGEGYPYKYNWFLTSPQLNDYTYLYGGKQKYGGFLYVDASDEARTITKLRFDNVKLCAGSELCYTAVVADMTSGNTAPRLVTKLFAIYPDGIKKHVASFLSCDLSTVVDGAEKHTKGEWYQVYGRVAVPTNLDLTEDGISYEVQVDNYAPNTDGADYCVDQIMFFTSNAKLHVSQNPANCGDEEVGLNAYLAADALETYKGKTLYWRFFNKDGTPVANVDYNGDGTVDENDMYGSTFIETGEAPALSDLSFKSDFMTNNEKKSGYFKDIDDNVYFSLVNMWFPLEQGKEYYISVYTIGEDPTDENGQWGNADDVCSVYSPVFFPRMMYLSLEDTNVEGKVITSVDIGCGSSNTEETVEAKAVIKVPDETEASGFRSYDLTFDYYMGSLDEFRSIQNESGVTLENALGHYRGWCDTKSDGTAGACSEYTETKGLAEAYESVDAVYFALIKAAVDDGKLHLKCSAEFNETIDKDKLTISALPLQRHVTASDGSDVEICSPLEFTFNVEGGIGDMPVMQLGFEDVAYPEDYVRVVRVGREQLLNMQKKDGYLLHVPVNNFNIGSGDDNTGALVFVGNLELLKEGTTDPTINDNNNKVATFAADEEVSAEKMYVSLNFHGEGVTQPDFREGFAYRMFFQVKKKDAGEGACTGNVEFILKVVPEFVTWTGKAGDTNTSWNNDANWTRSKCDELYKKTGQNTPTAAQGDGTDKGEYVDNAAALGQPDTYVPMKFTYVTMPTHNRAPVLAALTKGIDGIYNNVESGATENIQYDIMVRTELGCQGGDHHEKVEGYDIYDCEKFYGNCCKEIYFKPEAELVNQQHLTYEKAWVEKELVPAAWYLMSSPLRSVCSGDMFVPKSNGRQETEAFQPIAFDKEKGYSRTKYPVYQRSWKQEGAEVYTNENDMRGASYSANLPYSKSDVIETTMAQWSHVYNDFAVADTTLAGFSIRAHKESQQQNALLRLPKDDWYYQYFQWNENLPKDDYDLGREKWPGSHGKFKTVGSIDGLLTSPISLIQVNNGYALIGNPYMSSVRMSKFLEQNSSMIDGNAFWTYEVSDDGTSTELRAHGGSGTIRPMQAFFVKLKDGVSETGEITFTSDMMIDGNTSPETETAAAGVRMMAINSKGQSTAVVAYVDGSCNGYDVGEDVETFFDSNFSDAPTVYTVADTKAVSVNSLPNIDIVPFGVTCAGNDAVDVTITGTDLITQKLYVYDTANGMCAEIHDGEPISVQPNDYGRYYLTTRSSMNIGESVAQGIMVSVRDGQVTVTAADNIGSVTVTALNGNRVISLTDCGTSATFNLHQGMYLIKTEGDAGKQTVKIMVK